MIDFATLNNWGNPLKDSLTVACKGGCGRTFTASWDKGIKCRIVEFHCRCGAVTPVDGEVK